VAERKVQTLLEYGAQVTVVSPHFTPALERLGAEGAVTLRRERFAAPHLEGMVLAFSATDDEAVNQAVSREAQARGILVNVVDQPELCSFYCPAIVRRGHLTIAISTSGQSPALAALLRRQLETEFGEEYGRLSALLAELRPQVRAEVPADERSDFWYGLLAQRDTLLDLLRRGQEAEARRLLQECVSSSSA